MPTAYNARSSPYNISLYSNFEYFMGPCATGSRKDESRSYSFQSQPAGTEALRYKNLPKLIFHATLGNAKLKQYPYSKATAYFRVRQCQNFVLPAKKAGDHATILWRINESFDFQMTEYELRKQFLEVSILKEDGEQVGSIKINLFLIATGPFHQDFAIHFPQQRVGRISFDLKISQIIDLKIQSLESQILLNKKHPGQEFCYSIKTINGFSGSSFQSGYSYPAVVLLQKKAEEHGVDFLMQELQSINRRKSLRQIPKQIEEGKQLKWSQDGGELPVIKTKVVASQLHNIYFQILIWKYKSQIDTSKELFADTHVSLYKLLGTEAVIYKQGEQDLESRSITVSQKIQHSGKNYGTANFKFTIINQTYFKQYLLCVHTEDGILKTNPIFGIQGTTSTDKCAELHDLISLSDAVQQNVITLNKEQGSDSARYRIRRLIKQIQEDLSSIYQLLEKTYFSPSFLYNYSSEMDLLEGQKILVEFGMKLTQYVQSQDPVANDLCWLILISLIKRAQFNLGHMGFNEKQKRDIQSNKLDDLLIFKQEVANMYKAFLYKLLDLALNSINHKGSDYERTFAQIFSAYAYFCIPEFRKQILRLITSHESDPEVVEWRQSDFNLAEDRGRDKDKANTFKEMFDWEHHFYKYIRRDDRIQNNSISLPEILGQNQWKGRFIKRGLAFFYFIKYWVTYVDSTLHNSPYIQWNYFPGYTRLVRGFLVELKIRPILEYPDGIIEAIQKLLLNESLINPIIKILVTKVKAYDSTQVMRTISYLNMIFEAVGTRMKQIPVSFNYSFFFKAIKIMLEVDFSFTMGATLNLLYNHFNLFHLQFRRSLSMYLLGSVFFRLFLHWSHNVRYIFNNLISYKVYRDAVQQQIGVSSPQVADIKHNDVLHRYDEIMKIMTFELKQYQANRKPPLHPSIAKSYFKQMKIKLYQKNNNKSNMLKEQYYLDKNFIMSKSIESLPEINQSALHPMNSQLSINSDRSSSELWNNRKMKLMKKQAENQNNTKKDDIKRTSRTNRQFSYVHDHVGKRSSLFHQIIPPNEFIIPKIKESQLKYIESCLIAYRQIEKTLFEGLEKGSSEPPLIQQEISIDKREIRPGQYDQW